MNPAVRFPERPLRGSTPTHEPEVQLELSETRRDDTHPTPAPHRTEPSYPADLDPQQSPRYNPPPRNALALSTNSSRAPGEARSTWPLASPGACCHALLSLPTATSRLKKMPPRRQRTLPARGARLGHAELMVAGGPSPGIPCGPISVARWSWTLTCQHRQDAGPRASIASGEALARYWGLYRRSRCRGVRSDNPRVSRRPRQVGEQGSASERRGVSRASALKRSSNGPPTDLRRFP